MYFSNPTGVGYLLLIAPLLWGGLGAPLMAQNADTKNDGPPLGAPDRTVAGGDRGMCNDDSESGTQPSVILAALVPSDQILETAIAPPALYVRVPQVENAQLTIDIIDFSLEVEEPIVFESLPFTTNESEAIVRLVLPDSIQLTPTAPDAPYRYLWNASLVCSEYQADETGTLAVGGYLYPVFQDVTDSWLAQLETAFAAGATQPQQWVNWLTENGYGAWADLPMRTVKLEAVGPAQVESDSSN